MSDSHSDRTTPAPPTISGTTLDLRSAARQSRTETCANSGSLSHPSTTTTITAPLAHGVDAEHHAGGNTGLASGAVCAAAGGTTQSYSPMRGAVATPSLEPRSSTEVAAMVMQALATLDAHPRRERTRHDEAALTALLSSGRTIDDAVNELEGRNTPSQVLAVVSGVGRTAMLAEDELAQAEVNIDDLVIDDANAAPPPPTPPPVLPLQHVLASSSGGLSLDYEVD